MAEDTIPDSQLEMLRGKTKCNERTTDLEDMLDSLDKNLEDIMTQINSVKNTRDELLATTKKLQQNLELVSENTEADKKQIKKLETVSSEIRKREEVVRALETREMLLSHSMLAVISSWADELERNLTEKSVTVSSKQNINMLLEQVVIPSGAAKDVQTSEQESRQTKTSVTNITGTSSEQELEGTA